MKFKFKKGDFVYYKNPVTRDTIPAQVVSADNDCIVHNSRVKVRGNWPGGDRTLWVHCENLTLQKRDEEEYCFGFNRGPDCAG